MGENLAMAWVLSDEKNGTNSSKLEGGKQLQYCQFILLI